MDGDAIIAAARRQTNLTTSDVSDADVLLIINEGIREVSTQTRWEFLHTAATLATTSGTAEISLPADFMFMNLVSKNGEKDRPLNSISFSEYKYWYGDDASTASEASAYYIRYEDGTGKIGLYPTPNATASDVYDIFYYKNPTELANGSATPEWDSRFHSLLVDYVAYRLWEREEYFDESQRAFERYGRRLREMMTFYSTRHKVNRFIYGDGSAQGHDSWIRRRLGWQ